MVDKIFFLNEIFFKECIEDDSLVRQLKTIHKNMNRFEDPNIYYYPNSEEFSDLYKQIDSIKNKSLKIFLYQQLNKLLKMDDTTGNALNYCLREDNKCLVSISKSTMWHVNLYQQAEFKTDNIFDCSSMYSYLRENRFKNYFNYFLNQKNDSEKIGLLDNIYPKIKKVSFHNNFLEEYTEIDSTIKPKFDRILKDLFFGIKRLESYNYHSESETVRNNPKYREERRVKFHDCEKIIYMHLKITNDWSIYVEESDDRMLFGRLTAHLSTQNY